MMALGVGVKIKEIRTTNKQTMKSLGDDESDGENEEAFLFECMVLKNESMMTISFEERVV